MVSKLIENFDDSVKSDKFSTTNKVHVEVDECSTGTMKSQTLVNCFDMEAAKDRVC